MRIFLNSAVGSEVGSDLIVYSGVNNRRFLAAAVGFLPFVQTAVVLKSTASETSVLLPRRWLARLTRLARLIQCCFSPALLPVVLILSTLLTPCRAETDKLDAISMSPVANKRPLASDAAEQRFYELGHRYLQEHYRFHPSQATSDGVHEYDHFLEDVSQPSREKEQAFLRDSLQKFESLDPDKLSLEAADDLELIKQTIKNLLFENSELQLWRRNPDTYSSFVGSSLFPLIKRQFASLDERLKAVIDREKQIPKYLEDGVQNIDRQAVPRIYAQLASEQLPGIIDFFQNDVKQAFKEVKDQSLRSNFEQSNSHVVAALTRYQTFVKDLLSDKDACKGEFALGREKFCQLLNLSEMVDEPLDSLLSRGEAELQRLQGQFQETSLAIDSKSSTKELFESISKHHPGADKLLTAVKGVLGEVRSFIHDHKICTIPGAEDLRVEETPPFMRATTVAAMDTAGPFEKVAKEAFYFVTLPEKDWNEKKVEEHLRAYSYPDLLSTTIHEAYPGHYVQALWEHKLTSEVRKTFGCGSNSEGWAHYCEQMVLDQGFHKGDQELRLIQLHDALLRCCRYVVAIKMHTQGMTVDQAVDFFVKEGFMERANAEVEAKRGTVDPTYLVYTFGKLEILKLREEMKQKLGASFSLEKFHDKFLSIGDVPLPIVRREMLAGLNVQNSAHSSVKNSVQNQVPN